jgi:hypothetical protein
VLGKLMHPRNRSVDDVASEKGALVAYVHL